MLHKIIDEKQNAFVGGRNMLDIVLIANAWWIMQRGGSKNCLAFKVDFEKTYDCVSLEFLFYVMGRMTFNSKWIS